MHPPATHLQNMGVNHGRRHIGMAEQFLHRADIVPTLK